MCANREDLRERPEDQVRKAVVVREMVPTVGWGGDAVGTVLSFGVG